MHFMSLALKLQKSIVAGNVASISSDDSFELFGSFLSEEIAATHLIALSRDQLAF